MGDRLICEEYTPLPWTFIGIGIAVAILVVISLVVGSSFFLWHRHLIRLARLHKKLGPPGMLP